MFQVKEDGALYSVTVNQVCAQCGRHLRGRHKDQQESCKKVRDSRCHMLELETDVGRD